MIIGFGWTDERVADLKRMHADGLSASQIAGELGGITRNSVCGKIDRLGLAGKPRTYQPRVPKPKPAPTPPTRRMVVSRGKNGTYGDDAEMADLPEITDLPPDESDDACSILELTDTSCRWPIGDPGKPDFKYCGSDARGPYCGRHARIAYRPLGRR